MNIRTDHAEWTDRLSDYLAGDLTSSDRDRVEAHLAECGACRRVLEDLNRIVAEAAALGPIEPPRDLWGGIAATIQAPSAHRRDTKVIALPVAGASSAGVREGRKRLAFSVPQLAAAAIVLVTASSLATWAAGPGLASTTSGGVASTGGGSVTMASNATVSPPAEMADELASLEMMLREARAALDPNTVRVLERNLAVIEKAIDDSRQALLQDPENTFLSQHLERVFQRKLAYLRDAARVAEWSS